MGIRQAKVYHDGSHYIAIDGDAYPKRKSNSRPKPPDTAEKQEFDKAYKESLSMPKRERKKHINEAMQGMFKTKEQQKEY
ncbi:MAG: hypothetical protein NC131_12985, partial [Roseburia sp.]|nr:hypothetical protein [Roseburia sp.]